MGVFSPFSDFQKFHNENLNAFKSQGLTAFQKRSVQLGYLFLHTEGGARAVSHFLSLELEVRKQEFRSAWVVKVSNS